jgi:hypothetical protein
MELQGSKLAVGIREAAQMLGVSPRTIQNYIAAKLLPYRKIGRRTVIPVRGAACNYYGSTRPKVGEPFIPFKQFHVLPMPDSLLQSELPAGAKLIYARLCRFAGKKNFAWPTPETLGREVGLCKRQTQKHLRTLERKGFIRREERFIDGSQTSNHYVLLWNQLLEDNWETDRPREG